MTWKTIEGTVWFVAIILLAIALIENEGSTWMVEAAGDLFGAFGLMALATYKALQDED